MWLALVHGASFATAPLLSLSPFKVFVLSSSLQKGWRHSLPLALAPLIADIPVIVLLWLILRQMPGEAVRMLRIVGGGFYVYLAIGLIRNSTRIVDSDAVRNTERRSFWQAITAIWVTPQVYINWSLIGIPALMAQADESVSNAAAFLLGFYFVWVGGLAVQITVMSQAGRLDPNITRLLMTAGGLILIGFGVYQVWIGARGLLLS